jgi:transposase
MSPLSRKWVHLADDLEGKSPNASSNPFEMAEELKGLKKKNAQLRRDNEILLKASAFFASRNH